MTGKELMKIPKDYMIRSHIWMEPDIFYSDAFRCLSKSAILTLLRCLQKQKREKTKVGGKKKYVRTYNEFIFPYAEARDLLISNATQHWKNINKLVEVGFLEITYQGGWYQKHKREKDYSRYKLSERWRKYNTPEFVKVEKPKVLPASFHIKANMERKKLKLTSQNRSGPLHKSEGDGAVCENIRIHESEVGEQALENCQSFAGVI